jgi:hypothetical protein
VQPVVATRAARLAGTPARGYKPRMWLLGWLAGCEGGAGRIDQREPVQVLARDGWSVQLPAGARVDVSPDTIAVDADDGRRWFDIRWVPGPANEATARAWGDTYCAPAQWDSSWEAGRRWGAGGLCVVSERRHWLIVSLEAYGDRTLQTTFLADARRMPLEDAWVEAMRTAWTFRSGGGATDVLSPERVRALARLTATQMPGPIPVPGGGLFSPRMHALLSAVWLARDAHPPPPPHFASPGAAR